MNILGLDLGSIPAWCMIWGDGRVEWEQLGGPKGWLSFPRHERVIRFGEFLEDKIPLVDVVVYEEVQTSFGSGSWVIFRQEGTLLYVARAKPFFGVNPSTLKKFAVPGKKGTKARMMESAKVFLRNRGIDPPDLTDNEADAIMVAAWAEKNVESDA